MLHIKEIKRKHPTESGWRVFCEIGFQIPAQWSNGTYEKPWENLFLLKQCLVCEKYLNTRSGLLPLEREICESKAFTYSGARSSAIGRSQIDCLRKALDDIGTLYDVRVSFNCLIQSIFEFGECGKALQKCSKNLTTQICTNLLSSELGPVRSPSLSLGASGACTAFVDGGFLVASSKLLLELGHCCSAWGRDKPPWSVRVLNVHLKSWTACQRFNIYIL